MLCENCGVEHDSHACPNCGAQRPADTTRIPTWAWVSGVFILGLVLFGAVAAIGWRAYTDGLALRAARQREAAALHLGRADSLIAANELALAEQELIEALRLAPDYPAAQERLSRLHHPTPTATPAAAVRANPTPTVTPAPTASPAQVFASARRSIDTGAWRDAVATLENLRARSPSFETAAVTDLLIHAYVQAGLESVVANRLDEAMAYFDAALRLAPNHIEATEQRDLARLYLAALDPWDEDWPKVLDRLDALYQRAPRYHDVASRLALAHTIQGDRYIDSRQPCQAEAAYGRALAVVDQPDTRAKLTRARQACGSLVAPTATSAPARRFLPEIVGIRDEPGPTVQIVGRVLDRQRRGLWGYVVTVTAPNGRFFRATTDNTGQFAFTNLPPDVDYTVDVPAGIGPALPLRLEAGKQAVIAFVEP